MKTLKKQYCIVCLLLLAVCFLGFMKMPKVLAESNVAYGQTAASEINFNEIYQIQPGEFGEYADNQCGIGDVVSEKFSFDEMNTKTEIFEIQYYEESQLYYIEFDIYDNSGIMAYCLSLIIKFNEV